MYARFAGSVFGTADAFALQRHWRHVVRRWQQWHSRLPPMRRIESDIWWQRPVYDGRLHRVTPLHGDAGSLFWAKWELQSHTRGVFHSLLPSCCGCVHQFAARGPRTSPAPDAWLRAHQNFGSHDFCRCAHGQRVEEKGNNQVQTLRLNHGTTDSHPTEEHSEKHLFRKSIESTKTHTCAESALRLLPNVKCENRSRTTCSRFHRLHSESNLACGCGLWGSTRSSRAAHSSLPHALKR